MCARLTTKTCVQAFVITNLSLLRILTARVRLKELQQFAPPALGEVMLGYSGNKLRQRFPHRFSANAKVKFNTVLTTHT